MRVIKYRVALVAIVCTMMGLLVGCGHPVFYEESLSEPPKSQAYPTRLNSSVQAKRAQSSQYRFAVHEPQVDRENYLPIEENTVKAVTEEPISTFSVDVDTAAYSNIRRMLQREGRLPPKDAVRLEEMVNYFDYCYQPPKNTEQPFAVHTEIAPAPWNQKHHLLKVALKGYEYEPAQRPASNLVFLVDVSGSMQSADKLPLLKKSLQLLVKQLNGNDRVALVVYAGAAGVVLESTPGDQKAKIMAAIEQLEAGGSTHGSAGINLAYQVAQQHKIEGGINRIIIASDGDMNVGTVNIETLKSLIAEKRKSGISLTTLGYGSGNYNYALMEQLADIGNGNAAYISSLMEANKVLVQQMNATLNTIASDVKIQVEFNPALVREYRLIGYENRLLNREDFTNDKVDAGEIGAGHTVTAFYEVVLAGSGGEMLPVRRYAKAGEPQAHVQNVQAAYADELAFVRLRYKAAQQKSSEETAEAILLESVRPQLTEASEAFRFAAAVAGFGELLRGGEYTRDWGYAEMLALAQSAKGKDAYGYRGEFIQMATLAQSLATAE